MHRRGAGALADIPWGAHMQYASSSTSRSSSRRGTAKKSAELWVAFLLLLAAATVVASSIRRSSAPADTSVTFTEAETPLRFVPDPTNVGTVDTSWVNWVVISAMPASQASDSERASFLSDWDPDLIDWYGGLSFNRGEYARSRGVACSASEEYEYEESLQFATNDTLATFADDGMSRDEANRCAPYGPDKSKYYMELNAPKWKETIMQGDLRPAFYADVVTQDNIGSPINKASANYDDHSNARFLRWLSRRCMAAAVAMPARPCSAKLTAALQNATFNIRDHIAQARSNLSSHEYADSDASKATMEPCGSAKAPAIQDLQVTPGITGHIQFEGGKCLTIVAATKVNSGYATAAPCSSSSDLNQQWTVVDGVVRSARTDCAGAVGGKDSCCLSISSGSKASGTIVQLYGCVGVISDGFHLKFPQPGMKIARLVSNASGLCLTSGSGASPTHHDPDALLKDPVIHEFIRHGYISALQHWDDIASAVRQSQNHTGRKIPAIWGNQWGLPGTFPISALMSQTSDVVWVEGPPADDATTAWNALTYKVGDASGDFAKPVFTIEYGGGRATQTELAEAYANGGLMVTAWPRSGLPEGLRNAQFVGGAANRHLFVDRRRQGDVALLFSIPSIFWRRFSSLARGAAFAPKGFQFFDYFSGIARMFEDEHMSYETLFLHHPDLWSNHTAACNSGSKRSYPNRYGEFRTIVIAGVDAISENDIAMLGDFVVGRSGQCAFGSHVNPTFCAGGHLVIVGAGVGSLDEELQPRFTNGTSGHSPILAELEEQCADNASACNGGRITRIGDDNMTTFLSDKSNSHDLAQSIMPKAARRFVTTLPSFVRTNFFLHGLGPMVSITFYVAESTRNGTNGDTITLRTDVIPCYNKTIGVGSCEFRFHNLPLDVNVKATSPITPPAQLSADKSTVTVTLPSVGALAVLSIGSPGEAAARSAAAQLRKSYERLKIAVRSVDPIDSHCDHGGCKPSTPHFEAEVEQLLGMVQCEKKRRGTTPTEPVAVPCRSFVSMPPALRPVWTQQVQNLTAILRTRLSNVTALVAVTQKSDLAAILAASRTATHAFAFGSGKLNKTRWTNVKTDSQYDKATGFGWTSNTSHILLLPASVGADSSGPFAQFLAGGVDGATFAVNLDAGAYTVTVLVGCDECNMKTATTGVRVGAAATRGATRSNRGMAGDRVRSGVYQTRTMPLTVVKSGIQLFNFTGLAVGPQLSINNMGLATEAAFYSKIGWLVSAVLIHPRAASDSLPPRAKASLAMHEKLTKAMIDDWAVIGPFNDTTSTGLFRRVSTADGDRNLSHTHAGKAPRHHTVAWCRVRAISPVPVATTVGDDAKGSAAVLQTSIYCPAATTAAVSFSTAGTGVLSVWSADDRLIANATDRIYAGLFEAEVVLNITLPPGWNDIQLKTLSHFGGVDLWEAQASVHISNAGSGCHINACGRHLTAPMCQGSIPTAMIGS